MTCSLILLCEVDLKKKKVKPIIYFVCFVLCQDHSDDGALH